MKVKVISVFRDKLTGVFYTPGDVVEISDESRVLDMESRNLAERVELSSDDKDKKGAKSPKLKDV